MANNEKGERLKRVKEVLCKGEILHRNAVFDNTFLTFFFSD